VESFVKRLVPKQGLDENLYSNILISLTEAVNNAIVHGNRFDDKKKIVVSYRKQSGQIHLFISDEGSGFDPVNIPDPTDDTCLEKEGGRGVFLMKQLTDEIHFHDHGRTVQLMWKI
jgi:serine/threonine-protein kinase RsbW